MKRDLDIYRSFDNVSDLDQNMTNLLIQEAKKQFIFLNRKKIFKYQTELISKINKNIGPNIWENFISNYKKLATINQTLSQALDPKKQILIEKKLVDLLKPVNNEKKPFPNVNNLAVKTFIEKFNKEYNEVLQEEQKKLLEKYITSHDDDGLEFKLYLYEEIDRLKTVINEKIVSDKTGLSNKLQKIVERISNYNDRKIDRSLITEVLKVQSLTKEINL